MVQSFLRVLKCWKDNQVFAAFKDKLGKNQNKKKSRLRRDKSFE
jgi:hypothetical protein